MSRKIDVDTKTFIRFWLVILGFVIVALFLYRARVALAIIGISILLAIAIRPIADKVDKLILKKNHSTMASVLVYLGILIVIAIIVALVGPVLISETAKFINQLPETFERTIGGVDGLNSIGESFGITDLRGQIVSSLEGFSKTFMTNLGSTVFSSVSAIVGVLTKAVLILIMTLLFLLEGPAIMDGLWERLSGKRKDETVEVTKRITSKMARVVSTFFSKQVTVAILDGFVVTIIVLVLSFIFNFNSGLAAPMGVISALFYLIPMFGQVIGCFLVSLLLLFSSPLAALVYLAFYVIYGQIEASGIAPKLQGDALKLQPVIILISITIGTYMFGLVGAIIAIPIAGCVKVFLDEYPSIKELGEKN